MHDIVIFITDCFKKIYSILDKQFFPDFPVTYMQLIMGSIIIGFMFKFAFGGFKETEFRFNALNEKIDSMAAKNVSKKMEQLSRKRQLNKLYRDYKRKVRKM